MDINRKTAFEILWSMEKEQAYSNLALNHFIAKNKPISPPLVRELVYGVLENKILLDHQIAQCIKSSIAKVDKRTLIILRMGVYQLSMLSGIPEYAAINESVNLAKKYCHGQDRFVNAVLRTYTKIKDKLLLPDREQDLTQFLSVRYSYEPWLVNFWLSIFSADETEQLLAAGNQSPPLTIRTNLLKTTKEELKNKLTEAGFESEDGLEAQEALQVRGSGLLSTELFQKGYFSVQDESSMLAVIALDPQPGDSVVDVCAAPGGKTLFLSERMQNKGIIYAGDIHPHKLELLEQAARRNGTSIINTMCVDAVQGDVVLFQKADKVLVDAPCSGLGVIRRKPEIKYKNQEDGIYALATLQNKILETSASYLKNGGTLVYSTCTISPIENQQVVEEFLQKHEEFKLLSQRQFLPHIDGTDGFYIALLQKG